MVWTSEEETILYDNFSYFTTDILADEFLPERSQTAIKSKSRREGLRGDKHPNYRQISSLYKARKKDITLTENLKEFLWGLTLAEGTFVKASLGDRGDYKFTFTIEMVEDRLLHRLYDQIDIGCIYENSKESGGHKDSIIWSVSSIGEISEILIPIFDSIETEDWTKYEEYIDWRDEFYSYYDISRCRSALYKSDLNYPKWSSGDIDRIRELYPYLPTSDLEDIFPRRSKAAIQKRASIENIQKVDNFRLVQNIDNYDDSDFYSELKENMPFIRGYISGDGSFIESDGLYEISISSNENNTEELNQLVKMMGGYPFLDVEDNPREDHWKRSADLRIKNKPFLLCTFIPLLEQGIWYSASKERQFEEWKESLHNKVDIDTLWEQVERHNRARQKYNKLLNERKEKN